MERHGKGSHGRKLAALVEGATLLVVGDSASPVFPEALLPFAENRAPGRLRFNLLVNYGWQWDLRQALRSAAAGEAAGNIADALGSAHVSRIDLRVRWGGRQRLSGFLPLQCAYADFYALDTLWADMHVESQRDVLEWWYAVQDVTLGG